jgi:hypothetical protein
MTYSINSALHFLFSFFATLLPIKSNTTPSHYCAAPVEVGKKLFAQLRALNVEIHGHTHQFIHAKRKVKVDDSGIHLQ